MSRKFNLQEKAWLETGGRTENYILQCVVCQNKGYDKEKLVLAESKIFIDLIKKHYEQIELNQSQYCSECENIKGLNNANS